MHATHLLPGFDDRKEEEQAIEIMTKGITSVCCEHFCCSGPVLLTFSLLQTFMKMHKLIATISNRMEGEKELSEEEKIARKNVQTALAMSLQEMSLKFRADQKDYIDSAFSLLVVVLFPWALDHCLSFFWLHFVY